MFNDEPATAITEITRRNLFDELRLAKVNWAGRLSEADFLSRIFDLTRLRSNDHCCSNMASDIHMDRVSFSDWDDDWVFDDSLLNLLHAPDEVFLRFMCEMVHLIVRSGENTLADILRCPDHRIDPALAQRPRAPSGSE